MLNEVAGFTISNSGLRQPKYSAIFIVSTYGMTIIFGLIYEQFAQLIAIICFLAGIVRIGAPLFRLLKVRN